jgi:hypothetical protein
MPKEMLKAGDLKETHELHTFYLPEWVFLLASYEGAKELVRRGYLEKHERESQDNYDRRIKEAYGFSYSKSIVDLFNFYLFKKPVKRDMGKLKNDILWTEFNDDCNLFGDAWDDFLTEAGRWAGVTGLMGMLVDKASRSFDTRKEQLEENVYPYVVMYFPQDILDWKWDRDENNRPYLSYLKLLDEDKKYRLWWPDSWEIWEIPDEDDEGESAGDKAAAKINAREAELIDEGTNPLEEIPFVWLQNLRGKVRPIGISDIHDVSRIDVSILRNLSHGEEIISYAAFPMMRKPKQEAIPGHQQQAGEDLSGVTAVLEFDPEHPESKPDWLDASVKEPIDAVLAWIERKVMEIYRAVNAGGMASTEISTTAKSGTALKAEFQLLNSMLVRKAINLEKTERAIIDFWAAWENVDIGEVTIERERTYDVEDLATDLENILTASIIVKSEKFNKQLQKQVARKMLPASDIDIIKEIDEEIDTAPEIDEYANNFNNQNQPTQTQRQLPFEEEETEE